MSQTTCAACGGLLLLDWDIRAGKHRVCGLPTLDWRARAEAAERELAEVGVRGSPPPEGSYIQRQEARIEALHVRVAQLREALEILIDATDVLEESCSVAFTVARSALRAKEDKR